MLFLNDWHRMCDSLTQWRIIIFCRRKLEEKAQLKEDALQRSEQMLEEGVCGPVDVGRIVVGCMSEDSIDATKRKNDS